MTGEIIGTSYETKVATRACGTRCHKLIAAKRRRWESRLEAVRSSQQSEYSTQHR